MKTKLWIKPSIHKKGILRKKAKEMGLIKGDEKLSETDLNKIAELGGVWAKRANLARTLRKFVKGGKITAKYLKYYKEGFNNPSRYGTNEFLNNPKNNDEIGQALIAGATKRVKNIDSGKDYFLMNDADVKKEIGLMEHGGMYGKGGTVKRYGVYVFGSLHYDFSDELSANEYARLTLATHPTYKVEVKSFRKKLEHGGIIPIAINFLNKKVTLNDFKL